MFNKNHLSPLYKVQRSSTSLKCDILIGLVGLLSTNKSVKDVIRKRHSETDTKRNDIRLILFTLFISWNKLPRMFHNYGIMLEMF